MESLVKRKPTGVLEELVHEVKMLRSEVQENKNMLKEILNRSVKLNINSTLTLNSGQEIPMVGLGTWGGHTEDGKGGYIQKKFSERDNYKAVMAALKAGYRHIDTASFYFNEEEVGEAIRDSGIPRSEIFLTTKLWENKKTAYEGIEESLGKLKLDYVDLYLVHWPWPQRM